MALAGMALVTPALVTPAFSGQISSCPQYGVAEGLRTLDALQLAIALDLRQFGLITVMVAADQKLCRVAALSGCSAVNPEKPGPLL